MDHNQRPPRLLEKILYWLAFYPEQESLPGDFSEVFARLAQKRGRTAAVLWYQVNLLKMIPSYLYGQFTWGTEMIKNTLKITLRILKKNKGFSFINIFGLAVGLASAVLIFLWVQDELGYDRFHKNSESLYLVLMNSPEFGPYSHGPGALGPALKESFPEIKNFSRVFGHASAPVRHGDNLFTSRVLGVDPAFFDMFTFPVLHGDPENPLPDPQSMVLTRETAMKLFGTREAVGQTVGFEWWGEWHDFQVTAVIGDIPADSSIETDFFLPFPFVTLSGMDIESWEVHAYQTYVQLDKNLKPPGVGPKIAGLMAEHLPENPVTLSLFPLTRIHLHDPSGGGLISYVYIFSFIGCLILAIACINFLNLSTSRSQGRAREVGLRKIVGSTRSQLIRQFLGESVLMTLLAFAAALGLAALVLPSLNTLLGKQMSLQLTGVQIRGFLAIALLTGLLSGSYPAFILSAYHPARTLKEGRSPHSRGSGLRNILVVFQFVVSIFLIIATLSVDRQTRFMRSQDLGINKECVINMELRGGLRGNYGAIQTALLENPSIMSMSITNGSFTKRFATDGAEWEGKDPDTRMIMAIHAVDYDYASVFDIEMAEGRYFSREHPTDRTSGVIVNETAVRAMGLDDPLGKRLMVPLPFVGDREARIIGVVRDYHFRSLHQKIEPLILVLMPEWFTDLYIRIKPQNLPQTLASIENTIRTLAPDFPFEFTFLDDEIDGLYRAEMRIGALVRQGSILAVLIACLGLFGLAAYTVERRTKEIGIRRVLGASITEVVMLLSKRFAFWVILANVIAWPAAYLAMKTWQEGFAYRAGLPFWLFAASGALALVLALATVGHQALRAAAADPARSLKYE